MAEKMYDKKDNILWIGKSKFLKRSIIGCLICSMTILLLTNPLFIRPLYESESIVYVPLTILVQQLNQQGVGFAGDKEIDSYIQILKSRALKDSLIKRFILTKHYNIDNSDIQSYTKVIKLLDSRINIEKTRYGSVSIKVRDRNPEVAASMTTATVELGEKIKKELLYPNRLESLRYTKSLYEQKSNQVTTLEKQLDSIENVKRNGHFVYDFIYQKKISLYNLELKEFFLQKELYEREQKNFDTPLPKVYIVSEAAINPKPVWPKRILWAAIGAGLFIFILMTIEIINRDNRA